MRKNGIQMQKQVDKSHYEFSQYITKRRWTSMWHQLDEVFALEPDSVLEIGPGPGVFKSIANIFGLKVETLDIDTELEPDHVASADNMPFDNNTFDVVCAFQMLEHVPFTKSLEILREMARISKKGIVISLPDSSPVWIYNIHIPKHGEILFHFPRPFSKQKYHEFDGQHYWEINKKNYSEKEINKNILKSTGLKNIKSYRVHENPYHRFYVVT